MVLPRAAPKDPTARLPPPPSTDYFLKVKPDCTLKSPGTLLNHIDARTSKLEFLGMNLGISILKNYSDDCNVKDWFKEMILTISCT